MAFHRPEPRAVSPILNDIFNEMAGRGVTSEDMAQAIGKFTSGISGYRTGKRQPGILTVERMANVLGYRLRLEKLSEDEETE